MTNAIFQENINESSPIYKINFNERDTIGDSAFNRIETNF
jgi:hypothetical protein